MNTIVDTIKFSEMIKSKRGAEGLRSLASRIGVSPSTLSRVEQGNLPDIDTYVKLCGWLDVSTDFFLRSQKNQVAGHQGVVAHLRADRTLPQETTEALIRMINLAYESASKESSI